jgi:hypothetical protein
MDPRQALTVAALMLEFEAERTDQQRAPGWVTLRYGLAQVDV